MEMSAKVSRDSCHPILQWPRTINQKNDAQDDESIKNRLFAAAISSGRLAPLRTFLRVAELIAKETLSDFKIVDVDRYIQTLAMENLEGIDIGSVTFDAQTPYSDNFTYLRQWALWSSRGTITESEVKQSFEFIQRNGGVTFDAAMACPGQLHQGAMTFANAYCLIAESSSSWAVRKFVDNPILAPGFNLPCTRSGFLGVKNRTPLVHSLVEGQEATALLVLSVTNDDTLNCVDGTGKSALFYAVYREQLKVLYALLCRSGLEMNNSSKSISRLIDEMNASNREQIMHLFDLAAALFAHVPLLIYETVYRESCTTLPLPICDIIFNYYRMPYPVQNAAAAAATAAAAQTVATAA